MIGLPFLSGKTVAVMGLGRSGTATARALAKSGAKVWAWDDDAARRDAGRADGLEIVDLAACDFGAVTALLWSPGIPHTHPKPHSVALRARAAGCEMMCDIELLGRAQPLATYIAITGTNGKSTTTTLLAHILKEAGRNVEVGGNLGTPALDLAPLGQDGIYVLELSSYQLELIPHIVFDASILLNITPDHLARHGGMAGYIVAKRRIFDQAPGSTAVIGTDDEASRAIRDELVREAGRRVVPISSAETMPGGVYAPGGILIDDTNGDEARILDLREVASLPGRHNWQNAAAAYAAAKAVGIDADRICAAIRSYPGLAHRQELVAVIDGVSYVNDSKATNADAAEKALVCYDRIYWIAGGLPKEGGIASLSPVFPLITHAFLIGQAADAFAATLGAAVAHTLCGDLAAAVARARDMAVADGAKGAVVLLSPACASWDQFTSFEHRGDTFRHLVEALPGRRAAP